MTRWAFILTRCPTSLPCNVRARLTMCQDAFTAVALSTAITFCRVGIFCMPIETLMKSSGPYIRSRAKAFFRAKTAERAKALGVSADELTMMGTVGCQLLQLELLMQPLQMLLDTSAPCVTVLHIPI